MYRLRDGMHFWVELVLISHRSKGRSFRISAELVHRSCLNGGADDAGGGNRSLLLTKYYHYQIWIYRLRRRNAVMMVLVL